MSDDKSTSIAELRELVAKFIDERAWNQFHNPKNLAMSLGIEAAELMEHFQWLSLDEAEARADDHEHREGIADEIADCLAYLLALANRMELDLATELHQKMSKNAEKYPVELSRGKADPPQM